jgi:hypothetical protein
MRPMPPIQPNLFKIQSWSALSHQPRASGRGSDERSVPPSRASFASCSRPMSSLALSSSRCAPAAEPPDACRPHAVALVDEHDAGALE